MIKVFSSLFLLLLGFSFQLSGQAEDPILFSVAGDPVRVSEFTYIYTKTNGDQADFSKASLEEYLDLYIKFKLKVQKAKEMRLDTVEALQRELAGYRRQLADSYLISKEVTETLTREAYERMQQDVDISHIFFQLPRDADAEQIEEVREKAQSVKEQLDNGVSFNTLARSYSDDSSVRKNGGRIGYITALFPQGFYELETAAYQMPLGEISGPIRTPQGLHLIRVNDRRPARGQVEIAHIMLRTQNKPKYEVREQINELRAQLEAGANFEDLAREHSDDQRTATKGGYIGFIGVNQFQEAFEDAAFAIPEDGGISPVVESDIGYHLIKRISKKELGPYEEEKATIEALVKKDQRFEASKEGLIENIKEENGFQDYPLILEQFIQTQNDTFFTFRWKPPQRGASQVIINLADQKITMGDFYDYLAQSTRDRMRLSRTTKIGDGVKSLYQDFVKDVCLRYEERQLEEKYPEFKSLMREYEEGILLFEVTKQFVWDKAAQDTSGLKAFYPQVKDKYQWGRRALISEYKIPVRSKALLRPIREYAVDHTPAEVKDHFNYDELEFTQKEIEEGKSPEAKNVSSWETGYISTSKLNRPEEFYSFFKIESVTPARSKTLQEAKGYIIADYQDHLEKQWVEELRKAYEVDINREVLNSLIKS